MSNGENYRIFRFTPKTSFCDITGFLISRFCVYSVSIGVDGSRKIAQIILTPLFEQHRYENEVLMIRAEDKSYFDLTINSTWNSILMFGKSIGEFTITEVEEEV